MGYSTDFEGKLKFNRVLTVAEKSYLDKFATTRRMARKVDSKYGEEGEFFVDGDGFMGQDRDDTIIDYNRHPRTQPGLWCQWVPTEDGQYLEWDGGEKFYDYVEWLEYLINRVFPYIVEDGDEPLSVTGTIEWAGEDNEDVGRILVNNNVVTVQEGRIVYGAKEPTNHEVWTIINEALKDAGYEHQGGGDGSFGFEDEYQKGKYKVTIGIKAEN